jgi:RND family efflux transporter MFP subunit
LLRDALTSQAIYDAALTRLAESRAVLGTARADLQAAEAQSGYATILSPIPGIVIERNVEVGEMVAPGGFTSQQSTGAIVRIANLESLEVEADINESYIARVEIGQPVVIKVDAVPDHPYRGRLRQVVPTADRQRGTVQVKVTIEDRDQRLVPDMSCSVSFLVPGTDPASLDAAPRILVPVSAVHEERGERHVLVVESGRVRKVTVTVGPVEGDRIEIRSGLRGGEAVIREPGDGRKEGARVRAVPS